MRPLNSKTKRLNFPLPLLLDVIESMHGSTIFSLIDFRSGFFQCPLAERCQHMTAFGTFFGFFCFTRMPMGAVNAPTYFAKIMHKLFGNLPFVACYLDDLCIHSADIDSHFEHLAIVFEIIEKVNLSLNGAKCMWFAIEIKMLSYIISSDGVQPDSVLVESITKRADPRTLNQVISFVSAAQFYKRFIPRFAAIAAPLHYLTKKGIYFVIGEEQMMDEINKVTRITGNYVIEYPDGKTVHKTFLKLFRVSN